ncbi:hypothetical protein N7481_011137 [Penicillium waksmanii]|uniref:uncharacterized protein n=1 Tax=Penicillium waksmanii TaxID=69791 RepID=UPI002547B35B|nr:uncharacterized protein N7481_011137 [Penicillium waksmanii]KAJ5973927.1 hypothetical protein N7481_011137 [Penicillium waksmanii]
MSIARLHNKLLRKETKNSFWIGNKYYLLARICNWLSHSITWRTLGAQTQVAGRLINEALRLLPSGCFKGEIDRSILRKQLPESRHT